MALLAVGQLHVQFFKAAFGGDLALLQITQLCINLAHVRLNLLTARTGLLGQLGKPQHLYLQFVRAALALGSFAAGGAEALRGICVSGLGTHQSVARFLADHHLRPQLLVKVFNFLRTAQQAGLLGILRIKAHAVLRDAVAVFDKNNFTSVQLVARGQGIVELVCGVAAAKPVAQQSRLPRIVQPQQIGQRLQADGCVGPARQPGIWRRIKRQFGRRCIAAIGAGKAAHHVQARDFKRTKPLAQRGFQGVFPTLLDMNAAPQTLQAVQPVFGQPGLEFAISLDLFLQGLQRLKPGRQFSAFGRFCVDGLLLRAPVFVQLRHAVGQFVQPGLSHGLRFLGSCELGVEVDEPRFVGCIEGIAISRQALQPQTKGTRLFFNVALVCGQHLYLLLHLRHARALLVGLGLCAAQGFFKCWQLADLILALRGQQFGFFFGIDGLLGQAFKLYSRISLARCPLSGLLFQLCQALLDTQAAVHHKADFSFQPADFSTGFIQLALRLVDVVTCGIVRLPNGFQVSLNVAQVGDAAFQCIDGGFGVGLDAGLVGFAFSTFQKPQLVLLERAVGLQLVVAQRHFSLLFKPVQVGIELAQNVFDTGQVFTRVRKAVSGFAAAFLVLRHAGGFFQKQAQLFGLGFNNAADGALADDGVGARPEAGTKKNVLHIAAAHRLVVQVVA